MPSIKCLKAMKDSKGPTTMGTRASSWGLAEEVRGNSSGSVELPPGAILHLQSVPWLSVMTSTAGSREQQEDRTTEPRMAQAATGFQAISLSKQQAILHVIGRAETNAFAGAPALTSANTARIANQVTRFCTLIIITLQPCPLFQVAVPGLLPAPLKTTRV